VLLVMVLLAIVAAVAFVGPDVVREIRHVVHCVNHAQEAVC
jgi:predicted PurR-regulated permease PerM